MELISLFLFLSSIQGMEFLFAEEDPNESDDESEKGGDGCLSKRVIWSDLRATLLHALLWSNLCSKDGLSIFNWKERNNTDSNRLQK